MKNVQIIITGQVYKTGFLYFTKQIAERNGITGTVQYTDKHSIKIEATASEDAMNKFISYCRLGCLGSDVNKISIKESSGFHFRDFKIVDKEKMLS